MQQFIETQQDRLLDVLGGFDRIRFLGRKVSAQGVYGRYRTEVSSDVKTRTEGIRIKHRARQNSIKLYHKQHAVLRIETALRNTKDFKVYRSKQNDPEGPKGWHSLRKGVADLHRRAQVSQAANERYLDALSNTNTESTVGELSEPICRRIIRNGRNWRADSAGEG